MQGDFSRITFDRRNHYSGVRLQQGRVQLDADFNEQGDIVQHLLRTQLADLLGASGTSVAEDGFAIRIVDRSRHDALPASKAESLALSDIEIGAGRFYVAGVLCENERAVLASAQPHWPDDSHETAQGVSRVLVYLDVWQRHLTAAVNPAIREIALGGSDTSTRTQTVWQVRLLPLDEADRNGDDADQSDLLVAWQNWLDRQQQTSSLAVRCQSVGMTFDNHLYRVEVHDGHRPSFKWSRDNASLAFRVASIETEAESALRVQVEGLARRGAELQVGDVVEVADDRSVLRRQPRPLCRIQSIDVANERLTLAVPAGAGGDLSFTQAELRRLKNAILIRWDHGDQTNGADGAVIVRPNEWLVLEHGIEVKFTGEGRLSPGDYWTIPARAEAGGIEWPLGGAQRPHGSEHWFSPLAILAVRDGRWTVQRDMRPKFLPQIDIPLALDDLEKRLKEKLEESEDDLGKRIEALEHAVGIQYFWSDEEFEPGEIAARVADTVDRIERANQENARLLIGVIDQCVEQPDARYRSRVVMHGEHEVRVTGIVCPGDILVPGHRDGQARQAGLYIRPGTLLGKAVTGYRPTGPDQPGSVRAIIALG